MDGECCSGYKSTLGHGLCRGGNSTCKPYFKVCLTNFQDINKTSNLIMPTQRKSYLKRSADENTSTTGKQSVLKNLINRILSSIKVTHNYGENPSQIPVPFNQTTVGYTATNICSIAYWVSESDDFDKDKPIRLKARVPSSVVLNNLQSVSWFNKNTTQIGKIGQRVLVFVEMWHRVHNSEENDKLIARYLGQRNISIQLLPTNEKNWEEGGMLANTSAGISFKYHLRVFANFKHSSNALKTCPPGYKGADCSEVLCKAGCDKTHGYCDKPFECKCKLGWTGELTIALIVI